MKILFLSLIICSFYYSTSQHIIQPGINSSSILVGRTAGYASIQANTDGSGHLILDSRAGTYVSLNHYSTDHVAFVMGGGNVGVGTSTPVEKLDINGSVVIKDGYNLSWGGAYGANIPTITASTAQNSGIYFYPSGSTFGSAMKINASGNIGIGTNEPGNFKLWIHAQDNAYSNIRLTNDANILSGFQVGNTDYLSNDAEIWNYENGYFRIGTNNSEHIRVLANGNVGIGVTDPKSKFVVDGNVRSKEVKVMANISAPDYVFNDDYELRTLKETKEYIIKNKHLPEIPSADEFDKNGIDLGDMNMRLLKKIEELTLYQIELLERIEELEKKVGDFAPPSDKSKTLD